MTIRGNVKLKPRRSVFAAGGIALVLGIGVPAMAQAQVPVKAPAPGPLVGATGAEQMAFLPYVATNTFGTQGDLRRRPSRIAVGDSQCSPYITRIRWQRWGPKNAVGIGRAVIPRYSNTMSCGESLQRAKVRTTRVRLSRPRSCEGQAVAYMRIKLIQGGKSRYQYTRPCDW